MSRLQVGSCDDASELRLGRNTTSKIQIEAAISLRRSKTISWLHSVLHGEMRQIQRGVGFGRTCGIAAHLNAPYNSFPGCWRIANGQRRRDPFGALLIRERVYVVG